MIDLVEQYVEAGFYLDSTELPDFVPVFLEFASCLDPDAARDMLAQPAHVFAVLAERLDKRERSEEHTSELQSLMRISYAVFCLKKKKQTSTPRKRDETYHKATIQ